MIVHESKVATIRSVSDLAGKRIAIYDDPAAERWVTQNIPGAKITKFSGDSGWFEAVANDEADALIYDYPFAAEEIKAHPRTVIAKYNLNSSKYQIAVPKGNFDLIYEVNQSIDKLKATDEYAALMREYLTSASEVFTKAVPGRKTYTVKVGDTLSRIAGAQLGDATRWREIWDLNKERVANENLIYPRLVLIMPERGVTTGKTEGLTRSRARLGRDHHVDRPRLPVRIAERQMVHPCLGQRVIQCRPAGSRGRGGRDLRLKIRRIEHELRRKGRGSRDRDGHGLSGLTREVSRDAARCAARGCSREDHGRVEHDIQVRVRPIIVVSAGDERKGKREGEVTQALIH
jgi:hypothetical protein